LKLQQLDHQRDLVRENAKNSLQVAQQSFSPEVLLATSRSKPSPENLHMQRKVAIARKSCNFNLARKLEEELQILLVNVLCLTLDTMFNSGSVSVVLTSICHIYAGFRCEGASSSCNR
jgi:hypothetical protein